MRLECVDDAIGGVVAVDDRWDELVIAVPFFLNDMLVLGADFVVGHL